MVAEERSDWESVPLAPPAELRRERPATPKGAATVRTGRDAVRALLHGRDPRLLVVVGPCSIHDPDSAYEYGQRLRRAADELDDALVIVMRTYLEKPRTTVGWKGLVNDPRLDGSCDVAAGLRLGREILATITDLGMPCGAEVLDPLAARYFDDLLSWAAIGARTVESQTHRELASTLDLPVGFKNSTGGDLASAANAMIAARHPHTCLAIDAAGAVTRVRTRGNPDGHLVLRGGITSPNYGPDDVARALDLAGPAAPSRPILVDCSHDNSRKNPSRQAAVCGELVPEIARGCRGLLGVALESHLSPGHQTWIAGRPLAYGVSITDACLGWDETAELLRHLAGAVRTRRTPSTGHAKSFAASPNAA